ncbi:CpsD/CapB family tyrosine-protein kinase, partial [Rhodobacteraceae bacterium]|nr:CpsD/CapB family tyrosine-protein kinase [Paracoccaceae bacterium]
VASTVSGRRGAARAAAKSALWDEIPMFEAQEKKMHQSRIYSGEATAEAQHFDILRTKLMLEMRRNDWKRIAITSATPGCGKTTTACNLITGFGRQPEEFGMLFDMDFRRPSVSKSFGAAPAASLEDVFLGEVEFQDQALRMHPNTSVSMTTRSVSDPARVILRSQTAELLDRWQAEYEPDLMLFDMPPVLVSDETRGFLKLVDAVLIVAAAGTSTAAQIDEVEREVAQYSKVAGIVLNKCRFMDDEYSYNY